MGYKYNPFTGQFDLSGGGGPAASASWKDPVANEAALPPSGNDAGDARVTLDTSHVYIWTGSAWTDAITDAITPTETVTLTNKTMDGDDNTFTDIGISSLKTVLADANEFIVRDGSGAVVSANVVPAGTVVGTSDTQVLTNKTFDADSNTLSNVDDGNIKAGAAIDASKIADGSVSNTEFQYISTVSSNVQTQLDGKLGSLPVYNTIYVDMLGNDSTAVANDASKPCLTIAKALTLVTSPASANRWRIVLGIGAFIHSTSDLELPAWTWLMGQGGSGVATLTTVQVTGGSQEVKLGSGWTAASIRGGIVGLFLRGGTKLNMDFQTLVGVSSHTVELVNMGVSGVVTFKANTGTSDFLDANNIRLFSNLVISGGSVTVVGGDIRGSVTIDNSGTQNASVGLYQGLVAGNVTMTSSGANTVGCTLLNEFINGSLTLDGSAVTVVANRSLPPNASVSVLNGATLTREEDAYATAYVPAVGSDWPNPDPTTVQAGLDSLAAQVTVAAGSAITSLTGDVTATGPGAAAATLADSTVTNAKVAVGAAIDATKIADGSVSSTEFQYLNSATSNIQTQIDAKTTRVLPSFAQYVYVNYISGSDVTGNGSMDKPFQTIVQAMSTISDSGSTKPYVIGLLGARQVETADILLKPYVSIVGMGQSASYIRSPGFNIKPDPSLSASGSWNVLKGFYLGGGTGINWDLQALGGGSDCLLVIENITIGGVLNFKGRNAGGGDFLEMYVGIALGTTVFDSCFPQIQSFEFTDPVSITDTAGVGSAAATLNNVVLDAGLTLDSQAAVYLNNTVFPGSSSITTTNTNVINSYRGLPPVARRTLSGGTTVNYADDASMIPYTPTTGADWTNPDPVNVQEALDDLATAVSGTVGAAITSLTGDVTASGPGAAAATIANNAITNVKVDAAAAIARSKLASGTNYRILANSSSGVMSENAALTAARAVQSDANGQLESSAVTTTELGYVSGVTSSIQTQLAGKLTKSAGDLNETSFAGANNEATPVDVTGFAFANASVRSFQAFVSVFVDATSDLYEEFELFGVQRGSDWTLAVESSGDNSQVVFSVTNAGQVQYTSANYTGFSSMVIKFRAITTAV